MKTLKYIALSLFIALVLVGLVIGWLSMVRLISEARSASPVVYVTERSSPPQGAELYGFFELIYYYEGRGYSAQFFTLAQRDDFERNYLPTLGRVRGPSVDMSKLPQDPAEVLK